MTYNLDVLITKEYTKTITIEADSMEDAIKIAKQKDYDNVESKTISKNIYILNGEKVNNF